MKECSNDTLLTFYSLTLNLYELIKKNNYNGFSMSLIRRFCNSIVKCLRLLYKENIIHCDLKPENILLKQRGSSSIKVIDFGSSCYVNRCILAELYTGFPLFPGENEVEQLACIMERCLEWDPAERMTPDEAVQHEFLLPSSSSRHRSSRMTSSSSTGGLNNSSSQKSSCYSFAEISPSAANNSGAVVASITSTTTVSNAAIATTTNKSSRLATNGHHMSASTINGNTHNHSSNPHVQQQTSLAQSSSHLPDIKLNAGDKYNSMQKMAVRSKITSSVSDLESVQQYSLHRMYGGGNNGGSNGALGNHVGTSHINAQAATRKHLITGTLQPNTSSKYGGGIATLGHTHHNGNHHSTHLTAAHHNSAANNNINMSHSQSTGDVSAIFGRA
uniref:Protein kinase domain-containing protein n=1 Tax=Glossina pallidipes TaxID=7398 RepID=A0A1B0AJJ7_GLOPL